MITIAMLGGGRGAAAYYLDRAAGCAAEYYTGVAEAAGRWCGDGAAALGLSGSLAGETGVLLAGLLDGQLPDGTRVAAPVWRADVRGLLPAAPLLRALADRARARDVSVAELLADPALAARVARLSARVSGGRGWRVRLDASEAGRVAAAGGVDPVEVFRTGDGADRYTAAVSHADTRVDIRRCGLDVVVSAPKSVSLLHGLGPSELTRQVAEAHRRAVDAALGYLQTQTAHGLRGHQGDGRRAAWIDTDGFIAAAFDHRTSRADEPQLHTHLVVANLVHGTDGGFSAVDSRAVHRHARAAGGVYQAVLRGELTRRLGVAWTPVHRGVAEVAGIPAALLRAFSTRRRQIEAALAAAGGEGRHAAQAAAYATRRRKTHAEPAELRAGWRTRVAALGHDPDELIAAALQRQARPPVVDTERLTAWLLGPAGLTAHASTFTRRDVLTALTDALPPGAPLTLAGLEAMVDRVLGDRQVSVCRAGGVGERSYSTVELLATEARGLALADAPGPPPPLPAAWVHELLTRRGLTGMQRAVTLRLLLSQQRLEVVEGPAGSGKTTVLATLASGWRAVGLPVRGAALAALTAQRLQQATGIPSTSLSRLLADADRVDPATGRVAGLPAGGLVVVDEASMVGTRALVRLLHHVAAAHARLVLVGDRRQLREIDAGGLFAALAERPHPAARLTDNRRQHHDWERAALAALRAGHPQAALRVYDAHRRVHHHPDEASLTAAITEHYLAALEEHGPVGVVLLAVRRADVAALNTAVRTRLRATGRLPADQLLLFAPDGSALPLSAGDRLLVTRNDPARGVFNGTRATVTSLDAQRVGLRADDGAVLTVPAGWAAERLTHAYAMTVHKAQGLTTEVALLYGGALDGPAGYVGLSRGRVANHLYTTDDPFELAQRIARHPQHTLASQLDPDPDRLYRPPGRDLDRGLSR